MKHLLALLGLAWIASGQQHEVETLVGLPQYGVTLSGTAQAPVVRNLSGRTVIYIVLKLDYTEGASAYRPVSFRGVVPRLSNPLEGLPPGGVRTIYTEMPAQVRTRVNGVVSTPPAPLTAISVGLDGVTFSNGEFVGPDRGGKFESLAAQFAAERELATLVAAARNDPRKREAAWAEVNRLRPGGLPAYSQPQPPPYLLQAPRPPEDHLKMPLAQMLFSTLQRQGEAAAYDLAVREMSVPKLWKATQ